MIVVEGFDCSGKSTLARQIADRLGWPVFHTGGPTRDEADVRYCLARSVRRMRERCVQDRVTHISESVYSMLTAPAKAAIALRALHEVCDVTLVYCRPPINVLLHAVAMHQAKTHETAQHVLWVRERADELIRIYDTVVAVVSPRCDTYTYDWTAVGVERSMNALIELLEIDYS